MTTTSLSPVGISALAALVHELRPNWDRRGIAGAIHQLTDQIPASQLAIAFIRGADDIANDTPAALVHLNNRAWDSDWYPRCKTHPETRSRRTNGECASCYTDRHADIDGAIRDRGGRPIPPEAWGLLATVIRRPATPDGTTPCTDAASCTHLNQSTVQ